MKALHAAPAEGWASWPSKLWLVWCKWSVSAQRNTHFLPEGRKPGMWEALPCVWTQPLEVKDLSLCYAGAPNLVISGCFLCFFLFQFLSSDSQMVATLVSGLYQSLCQVSTLQILSREKTSSMFSCSFPFSSHQPAVTGHVGITKSEDGLPRLHLALQMQSWGLE